MKLPALIILFVLFTYCACAQKSWHTDEKVQVQWNGTWYPAQIIEVSGGRYKIHYENYGSNWDEWVTTERIKDVAPVKQNKITPEPAKTQSNNNVSCSFTPQPKATGERFSEALVKSLLYERYSFEVNTGGLSAPNQVGITFLQIQFQPSYINSVTVVPGRGAQRKQDGAPVDAVLHPFKAKYVVCKVYNNTTTHTQFESDFVVFIDRAHNWNCAVNSVPKITYLD